MKAHLYPSDEEPYDQRDINYISSEDDESFYCEVCDKDFPSEDALSKHKQEHKLCGIDGCTFSAHPALVEKHIAMQHNTGLYHKIKNISTPEDIEKWIMERKRKYPTKVNVELRKAEELEKVQRGEVIKQTQDTVKQHKRKKLLRSRNRKRTTREQPIKNVDTVQQKETYRGLPEFRGTLNLRDTDLPIENQINETIENVPEESINYISDEEEIPATLSGSVATTSSVPNLVANYESDSEDSNGPLEVPIKKEKLNDLTIGENNTKKDENIIIHNTQSSVNIQKCSDLQSPGKPVSKDFKSKRKQNTELNRDLKNKKRKYEINKKQPYTSQLLPKLLSRSIQHERNLICQCVKYIVDNNFFD